MNTCGKCRHWGFNVKDGGLYGHCVNPVIKGMTSISTTGAFPYIENGVSSFFENLNRCSVVFAEQFGCRFWEGDNEAHPGT